MPTIIKSGVISTKPIVKITSEMNQSTSSILLAVAWEVVSGPFQVGEFSSILSSSIERPSLIILWILVQQMRMAHQERNLKPKEQCQKEAKLNP
jgi:hypothetical protein